MRLPYVTCVLGDSAASRMKYGGGGEGSSLTYIFLTQRELVLHSWLCFLPMGFALGRLRQRQQKVDQDQRLNQDVALERDIAQLQTISNGPSTMQRMRYIPRA